jgi:PAS domain S-box-containing protein
MNNNTKDIQGLKEMLAKLEVSKENYRNLYENSVVAMFTTEVPSLKTIEVNQKGVELFGYSSKESFLKNFKAKDHFAHPEANQREQNLQTAQEQGEVRSIEQEMKKLDGTLLWVKIFIKINSEKKVAQTVVIDITEQKKLENDKKEYIKSLEDLLYMTSHRLRKPVACFLGLNNVFETDSILSQEELKQTMDHLKSSINELDVFTQELTTQLYEMKEKGKKQ